VRAAAEVDELALAIERQRRVGGESRLDVLGLEGLVEAADEVGRLRPGHLHPLEGLVGLDDPPHLGLDRRQVLVGDRPRCPHVVVEPLPDRGAEGEFDAVEEPHHGPGHHVGRGVPHHRQGAGVARVQRLELGGARRRQRGIEADRRAVQDRRDGPTGPRRARGRGVEGIGDAAGGIALADGAVGKAHGDHGARGRGRGFWGRFRSVAAPSIGRQAEPAVSRPRPPVA
jgi:hypothetical protein